MERNSWNYFLVNLGIENFNFKNIQVFSEYTIKKNGRIDILLKLSSSKEKKVIVIENKISADDQFQQLKRYYDSIVLEGYKEDEIEMVYLSLYGNEPSEDSINGLSEKIKDNIKVISYKNEILEWLESCIKEVVQVPIIRETLVQYERLLKKLTFKEEKNLSEELKNMILFNQEYLDILYKLPDVLDSIKIDLQLKFWEKLEERLSISLKEKGIVLEKGLTLPNYHYSESLIENFIEIVEIINFMV
ncbi:PD-(D/E)XK nuclease family protein [Fusobacterium ulcerans]|uniref:PDDEXK-like family protein n=1 Tax=Fusobacterium ulcerans TaxID=861 RepID=UPI0030B7E1BA